MRKVSFFFICFILLINLTSCSPKLGSIISSENKDGVVNIPTDSKFDTILKMIEQEKNKYSAEKIDFFKNERSKCETLKAKKNPIPYIKIKYGYSFFNVELIQDTMIMNIVKEPEDNADFTMVATFTFTGKKEDVPNNGIHIPQEIAYLLESKKLVGKSFAKDFISLIDKNKNSNMLSFGRISTIDGQGWVKGARNITEIMVFNFIDLKTNDIFNYGNLVLEKLGAPEYIEIEVEPTIDNETNKYNGPYKERDKYSSYIRDGEINYTYDHLADTSKIDKNYICNTFFNIGKYNANVKASDFLEDNHDKNKSTLSYNLDFVRNIGITSKAIIEKEAFEKQKIDLLKKTFVNYAQNLGEAVNKKSMKPLEPYLEKSSLLWNELENMVNGDSKAEDTPEIYLQEYKFSDSVSGTLNGSIVLSYYGKGITCNYKFKYVNDRFIFDKNSN